jgi:hypothetical protein
LTREGLKRINAEIAREKAAALGRAGERLTLIIQREAMGLRRPRFVDQLFPEPPPRART